jgi:ABC-type nickel/cobalt efflux system permease component RcnA
MRPVGVRARVFRNREGTSIDPVPFLVVSGLSLVGSLSFVPVYCLTLGLSMAVSVGAGVAVFLGLSGTAYHRMVWTHRPELRREIPPEERLTRLVYGVLVVVGVLLLLTLLLLSR